MFVFCCSVGQDFSRYIWAFGAGPLEFGFLVSGLVHFCWWGLPQPVGFSNDFRFLTFPCFSEFSVFPGFSVFSEFSIFSGLSVFWFSVSRVVPIYVSAV